MVSLIKKLRDLFLVKILWRKYEIARGFHAGVRVRIWGRNKIVIGKDFYIGRDSFIETDCIIGDYVIIGNKVAIVGKYDHNFQQVGVPIRKAEAIRDEKYSWKGNGPIVRIGDDVWVGYGATIMQGVTIQDGAIIAACSVVTKDVDPYSVYAGNPARKIRNRFDTQEELSEHIRQLKISK